MTTSRNKGNSIIAFPNEYVVVDLETTGWDPNYDGIIEIGAIRYSEGIEVNRFTTLVKPAATYLFRENEDYPDAIKVDGHWIAFVDSFIEELTGITNQMLWDAPSGEESILKLIDFIGDSIVIGHNVNFDVNFIYDSYKRVSNDDFQNNFVDTMRIARKLLPQLDHHRLMDLCEYYGFDYSGAHRSIQDCCLTHTCYLELKKEALQLYDTEENFQAQFKKKNHGRKLIVKDIVPDDSFRDPDSMLYAKEIAITGTLEKMHKKDAWQIIANIGGIPKDSVTRKTNYLVIADKNYSEMTIKKKNALKYKSQGFDIEVLSESIFYEIIGDQL